MQVRGALVEAGIDTTTEVEGMSIEQRLTHSLYVFSKGTNGFDWAQDPEGDAKELALAEEAADRSTEGVAGKEKGALRGGVGAADAKERADEAAFADARANAGQDKRT